MKNLNLDAFDVQDMTKQEMKQTDGGWLLAAIAIAGAAIYINNNYGDFVEGFKAGYNRTRN